MTEFNPELRGSPSCLTEANTAWRQSYFLVTIICLFLLPLVLLLLLYLVIARHLVAEPRASEGGGCGGNTRARRQVVVMLGTVVVCFFVCLLPFRIFMVWLILASPTSVNSIGMDCYYILLFFCRIMLYLNSAVNPILYNLMSSKFRNGFMRLCGLRRRRDVYFLRRRGFVRNSTINTTTLSLSLSGSRRAAVNGGNTRLAYSNKCVRTGPNATTGWRRPPESFV